MKRNVLNSPRLSELKKHRRRVVLGKFSISLFALIIIFAFLAYLSNLDNLNIETVEIAGNKVIDSELIKNTVEQKITGKYFWLFSKSNIFYYSQNTIKNALQDKYKRIRSVNFSIKENKILKVSIIEREAKFTWCGTIPSGKENLSPEENSQKCYFLDESGYIFDESPYFSGEVYFKFYGKTDNPFGGNSVDEPLGFYFFKENFKQLISFKDTLTNLKLKPVALYITEDKDIEIFLSSRVSLTTEPKIIFKMDSDFQKVAENLQAALTTEPLQSEFTKKYGTLLYIDLRFGNKVYYKFQ